MTAGPVWTGAVTDRIAGATCVFGLEWRSPQGADTLKSARSAVREMPGSLAVLRKDRWQYALGPASARGAISAAAVLAEQQDGSWIGVWPLPGNAAWWGLAVRHRTVYPVFGDTVLDGRDGARDWLTAYAETVEWDLVIAPADLIPADLVDAERRGGCILDFQELDTLLVPSRRSPVLMDPGHVSWRRILGGAAAAGLAAAFVVAASGQWREWLPAPAAEPVGRPVLPLPDGVPVPAVLDACLAALDRFAPASIPAGWQALSLGCRPGGPGVQAEVAISVHEWAPITLLGHPGAGGSASGPDRPGAALTRSGALGESRELPAAEPRAADAALARLVETLGGKAGEHLVVERLEPSFDPETHAPPTWSELHWTLRTRAPVRLWRRGLAQLPPGRLEAMTFTISTGEWRLSGRITVDPMLTSQEELRS